MKVSRSDWKDLAHQIIFRFSIRYMVLPLSPNLKIYSRRISLCKAQVGQMTSILDFPTSWDDCNGGIWH